ncbi:APC family permease [Oryzobacter sp. R7]|uniref:APC family permease n=1 Tax=Oryzobacter faecalis TaxID=3388656 RepID=UPI00398CE86B
MSRPTLARRLDLGDAVVIGLGSMLGAGVFVAFGPAIRAAGPLVLVSLLLAAAVASANATSSARLAARHPESGGTYVYGRERLGPFWGHLAGWGFVVGKTASCAAMALTVGAHLWPDRAHLVASAVVVLVTGIGAAGVQRSAAVTRVVVVLVLVVLLGAVVVLQVGVRRGTEVQPVLAPTPGGVLQGAGFLFFAFAGYARVATLGEEVVDPARTIPRAVALSLGATLVVYVAIAVSLTGFDQDAAARSDAPLADAVAAAGVPWLGTVVRATAVLAAGGALLALTLGVSRTTLAMARDGHLPRALATVHPRTRVPYRAELAVGAVVLVVVLVADVRDAIGFSSLAVLVYYAIANAAALTLDGSRVLRLVALAGLVGCLVVALSLPTASVLAGLAVLTVGAGTYLVRTRLRQS